MFGPLPPPPACVAYLFPRAGYTLRMFCIAFTTKMPGQTKKTCYAQSAQVRNIRKKMVEIMTEEASSEDLKGLMQKL